MSDTKLEPIPATEAEDAPAAAAERTRGWVLYGVVAAGAAAFLFIYRALRPAADWLTYDLMHLARNTRLGDAVNFFAYDTAKIVIHRAQKEVLQLFEKHKWPVTLSIGAVTCAHPPCTLDSLIEKSDNLMYAVKRTGKNMVKHDLLKG